MNPEPDRVIAVADVFGAPPARGELVPLLERFGRRAAAERGCRRYTFAASLSDADHFVFVGEWDSGDAMRRITAPMPSASSSSICTECSTAPAR
jgi:quinol monooxygenase YgiN